MALPALAVVGAAGASAVGSSLGSYFGQKNLARQEQSNYVKNQSMLYNMGQSAQVNAVGNAVLGAQAAGVSPAVALAGKFSGAQSGVAPMQSKSFRADSPDVVGALMAKAQIENIEAQTRKTDAEADLAITQVGRAGDEDAVIDRNIRSYLEQGLKDVSPDDPKAYAYKQLMMSNDLFSKGSLSGLQQFVDFSGQMSDVDLKRLDNAFQAGVIRLKSINGAAQALAAMPDAQRRAVLTSISRSIVEMAKMRSEVAVNEAKVPELEAQASKLATESRSIYHGDYASMLDDGNTRDAFIRLISDVLKSAGAGAGFGLGARAAGGKSSPKSSPKSAPKSRRSPAFSDFEY